MSVTGQQPTVLWSAVTSNHVLIVRHPVWRQRWLDCTFHASMIPLSHLFVVCNHCVSKGTFDNTKHTVNGMFNFSWLRNKSFFGIRKSFMFSNNYKGCSKVSRNSSECTTIVDQQSHGETRSSPKIIWFLFCLQRRASKTISVISKYVCDTLTNS